MGEAIKKLFFIRRLNDREHQMVSQNPGLNSIEVLDWNVDPGLTFDGSFPDDSNRRYGTERLKVGTTAFIQMSGLES